MRQQMTCSGVFDDNSGTIFVSLSIKTDFKGCTVSGCHQFIQHDKG